MNKKKALEALATGLDDRSKDSEAVKKAEEAIKGEPERPLLVRLLEELHANHDVSEDRVILDYQDGAAIGIAYRPGTYSDMTIVEGRDSFATVFLGREGVKLLVSALRDMGYMVVPPLEKKS